MKSCKSDPGLRHELSHLSIRSLTDTLQQREKKLAEINGNYVEQIRVLKSDNQALEDKITFLEDLLQSHGWSVQEIPREIQTEKKFLSQKIRIQVIALNDFTGRSQNELSFHKGDIIRVYDQNHSDWWRGELFGSVGLFPSALCEIVKFQSFEQPSSFLLPPSRFTPANSAGDFGVDQLNHVISSLQRDNEELHANLARSQTEIAHQRQIICTLEAELQSRDAQLKYWQEIDRTRTLHCYSYLQRVQAIEQTSLRLIARIDPSFTIEELSKTPEEPTSTDQVENPPKSGWKRFQNSSDSPGRLNTGKKVPSFASLHRTQSPVHSPLTLRKTNEISVSAPVCYRCRVELTDNVSIRITHSSRLIFIISKFVSH